MGKDVSKLQETAKDTGAWHAALMGLQSRRKLRDGTTVLSVGHRIKFLVQVCRIILEKGKRVMGTSFGKFIKMI